MKFGVADRLHLISPSNGYGENCTVVEGSTEILPIFSTLFVCWGNIRYMRYLQKLLSFIAVLLVL